MNFLILGLLLRYSEMPCTVCIKYTTIVHVKDSFINSALCLSGCDYDNRVCLDVTTVAKTLYKVQYYMDMLITLCKLVWAR